MSAAEVIGIATAIVGAMSAAMGALWKQGNDRATQIEKVWQGRMEDKDKEVAWLRQQLSELKATFATEAKEDRLVLEKFRETMQRALEPQRGR